MSNFPTIVIVFIASRKYTYELIENSKSELDITQLISNKVIYKNSKRFEFNLVTNFRVFVDQPIVKYPQSRMALT